MIAHRARWMVLAFALIARGASAQNAGTPPQDDVIARAMRDELARSMKELKMNQLDRPYFIAYTVTEHRSVGASATGGSLLTSHDRRFRALDVEVRVGDYAFDNSNFFGGMGGGMSLVAVGGDDGDYETPGGLPLDDDYLVFRRRLWLATDRAYKNALQQIAAKRAERLNRARTDSLADFTRETPTQTVDERPTAPGSRATAEALARALSGMAELRGLKTSRVRVGGASSRTWYINSEGTSYLVSRPSAGMTVTATAQSPDGRTISDATDVWTPSLDSLPPREQLQQTVRALALRLDSVRAAPLMERYSGPVLFEGRAAAELFSEQFVPALIAQRASGMGAALAAMGRGGQSFSDRVGSRVLPEYLSVIDDPTIESWKGVPLIGGYKVDDEGVLGRRKTLIDGGILASLLSTRTPVRGISNSSGNNRGGGAAPSNVIVQSSRSVSAAELRKLLLETVARRRLPFGIVVRALGTGGALDDPEAFRSFMQSSSGGRDALLTYRVYPDGREELVRDAHIQPPGVAAFKDIMAVSDSVYLFQDTGMSSVTRSLQTMMMAGPSGSGPSSFVVPSLLLEDVTFAKEEADLPSPPLSAPPGGTPLNLRQRDRDRGS